MVIASTIAAISMVLLFNLKADEATVIWPLSNIAIDNTYLAIYGPISTLVFVLEARGAFNLFSKQAKLTRRTVGVAQLILSFYCLVYTHTMQGYQLGFFAVLLAAIILAAQQYSHLGPMLACCILIIALFSAIALIDTDGVATWIMSDGGNIKRFYQISYISERFQLFGNGLGAPYQYVVSGIQYDGYGVEISYLNVIDKYGLMSVPIFLCYIATIYASFTNKRTPIEYRLISIGLMGYLFVALGNPVALSAYNVMLHCIALFLIADWRFLTTTTKS